MRIDYEGNKTTARGAQLEVLQYAMENNIINFTDIQAEILMKRKQELLDMHTYSIWQGKTDKKWYTYLPDDKQPRGIRKIKRTTKEALEDEVVKFWESKQYTEVVTFRDAYNLWRSKHDPTVTANTVAKYKTDYIRFFEDQDFLDIRMDCLTDDDVNLFMVNTIKRLGLQAETTRKLYGYISSAVYFARKYKIIKDNPLEFIKASDYYKYCKVVYKPADKQILSSEELHKLQEQFAKDHQKKPYYMPTYAVELAMLTGMRAGELSALRWNRITDEYVIIDSSEKTNPKKNEFTVEGTKNKSIRLFPIDTEIRQLLDKIKLVQQEFGYDSEWVFANEDGRIHGKTISACIKTKCRQTGVKECGIYTLRKTFNSGLRCNGVSAVVASQLLGHSPETNNKYYTFDNTTLKQKNKIVSEVNAKTKGTRGDTFPEVSNF